MWTAAAAATSRVTNCSLRQEGGHFSCERGCTRGDYGKAGPFAAERLNMDLPFANFVCVCNPVHREMPALLLRPARSRVAIGRGAEGLSECIAAVRAHWRGGSPQSSSRDVDGWLVADCSCESHRVTCSRRLFSMKCVWNARISGSPNLPRGAVTIRCRTVTKDPKPRALKWPFQPFQLSGFQPFQFSGS